jgi:hypothetical protein
MDPQNSNHPKRLKVEKPAAVLDEAAMEYERMLQEMDADGASDVRWLLDLKRFLDMWSLDNACSKTVRNFIRQLLQIVDARKADLGIEAAWPTLSKSDEHKKEKEWMSAFTNFLSVREGKEVSEAERTFLGRLQRRVGAVKFAMRMDYVQRCLYRVIEAMYGGPRYGSGWSAEDFIIDYDLLVLASCRTGMRRYLLEALPQFEEKSIRELRFEFGSYFTASSDPTNFPSQRLIVASAVMIGKVLGSLPWLQALSVRAAGTDPSGSEVLATVIGHCHQVKKITMCLGDHEQSAVLGALRSLASALRMHPSLEAVEIECCEGFADIRELIPALSTMEKLTTLTIHSHPQVFEITTVADAILLAQLLGTPSLTNVCLLSKFRFGGPEEAFNRFCNGLATSNVTKLRVPLQIPKDRGAAMAQALVSSKLVELELWTDESCPDFFPAFGSGLRHASTLQVLSLLDVHRTEDLAAMLQDAPGWHLTSLTLKLHGCLWTESVEQSLSDYISRNLTLQTLIVDWKSPDPDPDPHFGWFDLFVEDIAALHPPPPSPTIASDMLLQAAGFGSGSLDKVKFTGHFDWGWVTQMQQRVVLNCNRQKRLHGADFEAIASGETGRLRRLLMAQALVTLDVRTCFGFLRDNEQTCRDILSQTPDDTSTPT